MKRILFMILRLFYIAPVYFWRLWWYSWHLERYDDDKCFAFLKDMTTRVNKAGRVKIDVHGLENIPEQDGFIFFPNHQGLFDVLTFLESSPKKFRIVMKKEVANIVLVKQVRLLLRGLSIDREDVRASIKVIQQMTKEVKTGKNYLIFAEGTRSRNKNELLEFKGGSFKSAVNARCPIVPVALIDSYQSFDTNSIKPLTVQIHYLKPIPYEEYKGMKTTEIAEMVRERIQTVIHENEHK